MDENSNNNLVRVQFDIDSTLLNRALPYIKHEKARHVFGFVAFEEWVNRKEGHDKRAIAARVESFKRDLKPLIAEIVQEVLDSEA